MSTQKLSGRVGLVTGGGRGIGAAIAFKLAGLGARVVICGRDMGRLQRKAEEIRSSGLDCEATSCDVPTGALFHHWQECSRRSSAALTFWSTMPA